MRYSSEVERYFDDPPNVGVLSGPQRQLGVGAAGGVRHGARVEFHIRVDEGVVQEARFRAYGCPCTIAAAARAAEKLQGLGVAAMGKFDPHELAAELGLPADKLTGVLLVEDALRASLADWRSRGS